jgi:hypothetical protein
LLPPEQVDKLEEFWFSFSSSSATCCSSKTILASRATSAASSSRIRSSRASPTAEQIAHFSPNGKRREIMERDRSLAQAPPAIPRYP